MSFVRSLLIFVSTLTMALPAVMAQGSTAELFGRADGMSAPELSPSGDHLAVACAPNGSPSICIFDIVSGSAPILIPLDSKSRLKEFYWASDTYLIFVIGTYEKLQLASGLFEEEFTRAISYNIETSDAQMLLKDRRNMLDTSNVVAILPNKPNEVLVYGMFPSTASTTGTIGTYGSKWILGTYRANLKTGKSRRNESFTPATDSAVFDQDGNVIARTIFDEKYGKFQIIHNKKTIFETDSVSVIPAYVYGLDSSSGDLLVFFDTIERSGLHYLSLTDGAIKPVQIDGQEVGRVGAITDSYTSQLVGFSYTNDLEGQIFTDQKIKAAQTTAQKAFADKSINVISWNASKTKFVIRAESAGRPADYFVYDSSKGQIAPVGSRASHLQNETLGSVTAITYTARDGLNIPAYLTLPQAKTSDSGPLPLIVMPHGGPEARDTAAYDWWAQAYARQGYAVLQPNFRGSSGYGIAHRNAGFGEFGGKMVDDVIDAAAWAKAQGIATDGGYCVVGASYGGYSALMTAIKDDANVKCAISVNGLTDPFVQISRFDDTSSTHEYWARYLGASRFSDASDRTAITPRKRAGEISSNTLVLHGREDTRVLFDQFTLFKKAADGKDNFRFVPIDGEDHFLQSTQARFKVLNETLSFLAAHHPAG